MTHAVIGVEVIPALLVLTFAVPALVHHITGRRSPFDHDPVDLYLEAAKTLVRVLSGQYTRR
ncbi:hypothetical protein ACIGDM_01080 [Rothia koreensis]|uniref:hypothetical protein n=1 Tax=Rothia koreensis TaxID=592378 RepID=UPI0037C6ACEA